MKKSLYILFFLLLCNFVDAQEAPKPKPKLYAGYGLFINYNLYSWYQKPTTIEAPSRSSGQIFNVLPGLGFNFWLGDIDHWLLALDGGIEYYPFAIDLDGYRGMGALSIPVLAKVQFPVAKQKSLWLMLHLGAGVQFVKTDLHNRPIDLQNSPNPFFVNIIF